MNEYLTAELTIIRMVQQVEKTILDAVDLELIFTPTVEDDD